MSSTNKTANFKLSQFIGTDKPTFLGDYNNDMEIIDGALFTASQTAEEAVNDVETVKSAQAELKAVHEDTKKQVAQLKETADGMSGDVTAAQEAANRAEQKATAAQTAATNVVNAANAASANATKAKQTADGNKTALQGLDSRVTALESAPKAREIVFKCVAGGGATLQAGSETKFYKTLDNMTLKSVTITNAKNAVIVTGVTGLSNTVIRPPQTTPITFTADQVTGNEFGIGRNAGDSNYPVVVSADVALTYIVNA